MFVDLFENNGLYHHIKPKRAAQLVSCFATAQIQTVSNLDLLHMLFSTCVPHLVSSDVDLSSRLTDPTTALYCPCSIQSVQVAPSVRLQHQHSGASFGRFQLHSIAVLCTTMRQWNVSGMVVMTGYVYVMKSRRMFLGNKIYCMCICPIAKAQT